MGGQILKQQRGKRGQQAAGELLQQRQQEQLVRVGKAIDHKDIHGKQQRTDKRQCVAQIQTVGAAKAHQIYPANAQSHADPNLERGALAAKQTDKRHKDDIQRRQKRGLAHARVDQTELLQRQAHKQEAAQQQPAAYRTPPVRLRLARRKRVLSAAAGDEPNEQQERRAQGAAQGVEAEGRQKAQPLVHCYDGAAPKKGGKEQAKAAAARIRLTN